MYKLSELAVKLAREAHFGEKVMITCTIRGMRGQQALSADRLENLLRCLSFSRFLIKEIESKSDESHALILLGKLAKTVSLKKAKKMLQKLILNFNRLLNNYQ